MANSPVILELAQICSLCNESGITYEPSDQTYKNVGEPTEAALKVLVEKLGTDDSSFNAQLPHLNPADRVQACNSHFESKIKKVYVIAMNMI